MGFCFVFFFFKVKSEPLVAVSTARITPPAAHLPSPSCSHCTAPAPNFGLFWFVFFTFHPNPTVRTLPGAPRACNVPRVCPVSAAFAPPGCGFASPRRFVSAGSAPRVGFAPRAHGCLLPFPTARGKTLRYRVQAALRGALLKDGVYVAALHPGSAQPRAPFGQKAKKPQRSLALRRGRECCCSPAGDPIPRRALPPRGMLTRSPESRSCIPWLRWSPARAPSVLPRCAGAARDPFPPPPPFQLDRGAGMRSGGSERSVFPPVG